MNTVNRAEFKQKGVEGDDFNHGGHQNEVDFTYLKNNGSTWRKLKPKLILNWLKESKIRA